MTDTSNLGATDSWAVKTHGLRKLYRRETALAGVDLRVPTGAVYVLVGVNGAGKSTLLKLLMNLERPDGGRAEIFGLDTAINGPNARAQVGYVSERPEPGYKWMTGARLLRHAAAFYPTWDSQYVERLTRALDLRLDRKIGGLSKGEARRLQLTLALAHRPPLLLLDEPTDGLDPAARRTLLALLAEQLADSPTSVVLTTHHVQEVESLTDHIGVLSRGALVAQMSRDDLHRTVRRYRATIPDRWSMPASLEIVSERRSRDGSEAQWIAIGEESDVTAQLMASGASVRDVAALSLEESALALLPQEAAR